MSAMDSFKQWRGNASEPPRVGILDWREVPTFSEFEIMRDAFTALGVPTMICDPRDLEFSRSSGLAAQGRQPHGLAVLVGQLEVRGGCAGADHRGG